ncbi:MAG TPA: hypothetical protein VGS22_21935 [Thermoanaerobaculia bacterium]|jgi:hypothetical protein|nr:hypothetical protein [Thermoanaerobaculia bacterium]
MFPGTALALIAVLVSVGADAAGSAPLAPIPLDQARLALDEAHLACTEDAGKLWGRTLCGPLLLVDPASRFVVANEPDGEGLLAPREGVFTATLPDTVVVANTATSWAGKRWTMVMWPSVGPRPVQQRRLLMHESFHRIQEDLGLPAANANNPHLDELEGRYWFLLELRALAAALRSEDPHAAIADALAFRAHRQATFDGAAALERALENNEGLAEYTGYALRGTADAETRLAAAQRLDDVDRDHSFVRGFAYLTGPAYGLLLDEKSAGWQRSFSATSDLPAMLGAAVGVSAAGDAAASRARVYDDGTLRAAEEGRAARQAALLTGYRARLVDGPVLAISLDGANYGFDPDTVVALGDAGVVYPELEVSGPWGTLHTAEGVLLDSAHGRLIFGAMDSTGIRLEAGWKLGPGPRKGDLVLVAPAAPQPTKP